MIPSARTGLFRLLYTVSGVANSLCGAANAKGICLRPIGILKCFQYSFVLLFFFSLLLVDFQICIC